MQVPLEPGDRKFLIASGAVLLVLLVGVVALSPPTESQQSAGFPSSYSPAWDGAKAAFLLLKDLGYQAARWERPPTELPSPPSHTILILAQPFPLSTSEERQSIGNFIRQGGRVLAMGRSAASVVPEGGALDYEPVSYGWRTFPAVIPSPLARGAHEITMEPRARWQMAHFRHLGLYAQGIDSVVVSYSYGKGEVIWWAAPTPITNAGIRQPGNLQLLLNSLGAPGSTRVLWDEYYHGQRGSLWSYFAGTPLVWGLAQLGVLALAALATFARRSGPVRPLAAESRLSPLEFVDTLGDLYHRAHAGSAAVATTYQRLWYLLAQRLALPVGAPVTQLHQAVRERLGWREPGFYETLQRAEWASRDPAFGDAQALQLVQALEHYARLLGVQPRNPGEERAWRNR